MFQQVPYSEIFKKEHHCKAMKDIAEWCKCKAFETDGEGSVLKYMTEPESRRQRSRCVAMQTSFFMSARVRWGALPPCPTSFSCLDTRKGSKRKSRRQGAPAKFAGGTKGCLPSLPGTRFAGAHAHTPHEKERGVPSRAPLQSNEKNLRINTPRFSGCRQIGLAPIVH